MTLRQFPDVQPLPLSDLKNRKHYECFVLAMNDDFNTREALAVMYDMIRQINTLAVTDKAEASLLVGELKSLGDIFGILDSSPEVFMQGGTIVGWA